MEYLAPIIIGLFLLAVFLRIDFYFHVVYLLAGAYVLARLWTRYGIQHLEAQRRLDRGDRAFPGESVAVELRLRNTGRLPLPWVEIHDSLPVDLISPPFYREVVTLKGKEEQRFTYTLTCYKRGYYPLGPLSLQTGDVLGLAPDLSRRSQREYLIVYPRVLSLEKLGLPTHSPLAQLPTPTPLFEDPTNIIGVRPYMAGDSPRRIHWTATANSGQLLVKRYRAAIARESLVCLDLDMNDYPTRRIYDAVELAIVASASIANHVVNQERLGVGLATQAVDPLQDATVQFSLPPHRGRAHLMNILEVLARAQMTDKAPQPFPDFLRKESLALPWGCTLIVITGCETEALSDALAYLRRTGFAIALILVMPPAPGADTTQRGALLNVPVHRVWQETALEAL
ncbi:MAG TPA: DUF58 domain-containing protein [Anaerolineae bacterium]|nr:DUF58 domain-containing protein [Anaerolineae bacterium]